MRKVYRFGQLFSFIDKTAVAGTVISITMILAAPQKQVGFNDVFGRYVLPY